MPKEKKKAGRPAQSPGDIKRHPLNMRTTKVLRDRLEAEADLSGRSLAQEVEFRLERSFLDDDASKRAIEAAFGDQLAFRLFKIFAAAKALIELRTRKKMKDDWETHLSIQRAWQHITASLAPKRPDNWPSEPPTPDFEPTGLMGPVKVKIDEAYLEALETYRAPSLLGEAAAEVVLEDLAKVVKRTEQQNTKE